MILSDIKRYLQERGQATLGDLALHFDVDPDAMRGMLARWVEKGKVARIAGPSGCKRGCTACGCDSSMEAYVWRC